MHMTSYRGVAWHPDFNSDVNKDWTCKDKDRDKDKDFTQQLFTASCS